MIAEVAGDFHVGYSEVESHALEHIETHQLVSA